MHKNLSLFNYNLETSEQISFICSDFMKKYNLTYFAYLKFFSDDSFIRLSNHSEWTKKYFQNKFFEDTSFYKDHWNKVSNNGLRQFLWIAQEKNNIYKEFYNNNIWNGLSIYVRKGGVLETCSYATDIKNTNVNNLYFSYNSEFQNFLYFFKKKSINIINNAQPCKLSKKYTFVNSL